MKAIKYYAEPAFGAWDKTGYLFENSVFICEFLYYKVPHYIRRGYDFNNPPEYTTWGANVIDHNSISSLPGAFSDYQTFSKRNEIVELDFEEIKNRILRTNVIYWPEKYHTSSPL